MVPFLFQAWSGGRGSAGMPHDSTIGVGPGWYWFSLAVLVFIALGVGKVALEEGKWNGRFIRFGDTRDTTEKRKKQHDVATRINKMSPEERRAFRNFVTKKKGFRE